jgi:hypothetical protein
MYNCIKRFFRCCRKYDKSDIYTLRLEDNKYYVGKSDDIKNRIKLHRTNKGSYWTKKYPVIEQVPNITSDNGPFRELIETLECINMYGIDNVRGSMFTQLNLSLSDKIKAAELYCEMYDLCRKCGSNKHYITKCKNNSVEPWVLKFGGRIQGPRCCLNCSENIDNLPNYCKYCYKCYKKL